MDYTSGRARISRDIYVIMRMFAKPPNKLLLFRNRSNAAHRRHHRDCMRIRGSPRSERFLSFSWRLLVGCFVSALVSSGGLELEPLEKGDEPPRTYGDITDDHSLNIAYSGIFEEHKCSSSVPVREALTMRYNHQTHAPNAPLPT